MAVDDVLVFTKEQAIAELPKAFDSKDRALSLEFAPEKRLLMSQLRNALAEENEPDLFSTNDGGDDVPVLSVDALRAICAVRHPDLDFTDTSPEEIALLAAVTSSATTPEEQVLGFFTRRKLKRLDT